MTLRVFGLTGGIGSGKSTVARLLRERGVPVVDADELAREAVAPGSAGLSEVVAAFGADVLDGAGALDRQRLGERVFADAEARKRLNSITHPIVRRLSQERFAELDRQGVELAAYDVPLLFEVGLDTVLRPTVVVASSQATQLARVSARDGLSEAAVLARIAAQMPLSEKRRRADHVLENDGTLEELGRQVDALLLRLRDSAPG
ncbi:MAG TPA: dephospho-CoA kinase [Polyangiaceae bacterium]|nr:dephospho-CoA kinase [Polyangiaceae bacterium]